MRDPGSEPSDERSWEAVHGVNNGNLAGRVADPEGA